MMPSSPKATGGVRFQGALITLYADNKVPSAHVKLLRSGNPAIGDDEVRFTVHSNGRRTITEFRHAEIGNLSADLADALDQKHHGIFDLLQKGDFAGIADVASSKRELRKVMDNAATALERIVNNLNSAHITGVFEEGLHKDGMGEERHGRVYHADVMGPSMLKSHLHKVLGLLKREEAKYLPEVKLVRQRLFGKPTIHASQALEWSGPLEIPPKPPEFVMIASYKMFQDALNNADTNKHYVFSPVGLNDTVMQMRKIYKDPFIHEALKKMGLSDAVIAKYMTEEKRAMTLEEAKQELARLSENTGEAAQVSPQKIIDLLTELCGPDARKFLELFEQKKIVTEKLTATQADHIYDELSEADAEFFVQLVLKDIIKVEPAPMPEAGKPKAAEAEAPPTAGTEPKPDSEN